MCCLRLRESGNFFRYGRRNELVNRHPFLFRNFPDMTMNGFRQTQTQSTRNISSSSSWGVIDLTPNSSTFLKSFLLWVTLNFAPEAMSKSKDPDWRSCI